ncbi:MAG: hypothetical protein IPM18_10430 [Phycisphaerales bacterium]|nr:hypothetical protein [Phycisphaerales bacterium]
MTRTNPQSSDKLPLGADPHRSRRPLLIWSAAFALWFAFLVWLALSYPGR